jgi:F-type H+-transporting ATPase subunit beta
MSPDPLLLERARKLQSFFAQPFFVAEPYTKRPGSHVSLSDALRGARHPRRQARRLARGGLHFSGSMAEIRVRARRVRAEAWLSGARQVENA